MSEFDTIAPQHEPDLCTEEMQKHAYIIEGVAYSPLKMTYLSTNHSEELELRCNSCKWTTTVGELPQDSGYVQPDMCPACAKKDELGFVDHESPADGTLPAGWNDRRDNYK